jgi:UDP-2,3-diacylglucosamine hydrolase
MKCLFISDVHYPKSRKVLDFLLDSYTEFDRVYVLGDLFEFYYGYDNFIYPHHVGLINVLNVISRKLKVYLFEGNHEYRLESIKTFLNVEVVKNSLKENFDGIRVYMEHGDLADKKDVSYRIFRAALKNKLMLSIIDRIDSEMLLKLSKSASKFSKDSLKKKDYRDTENALRKFAEDKFMQGYDVSILAHTHKPAIEKLSGGLYINCGDFFENFSYVTYSTGEGFKLKYYK